MPPLTSEEILDNLNTNAIATVAELTTAINTAIAAMNALKDKASIQTDKTDEIFAAAPANVTLPSGDIVPNFAKVRADLTAAITAFTSVAYLEANAQAVDSAKLDGKTLSTIASDIKTEIIGAAPALLDTLEEIATALGDDDTAINGLLTQLSTLSSDLSTLATALDGKAAVVHEHDSRYYTKTEVDAKGFKNYIINGEFKVRQRGSSFSNPIAGTFLSDRWWLPVSSNFPARTLNVTHLDGGVPFGSYIRLNYTSVTGAVVDYLSQRIEDVTRLAGKTVTLSFYASCSIPTVQMDVIASQFFGSGGSAFVTAHDSSEVTLTSVVTRYSWTFTMPSIDGKTVGAGNYTEIHLRPFLDAGENCDIYITKVQLEEGSVATPFENRPYSDELALCRRYFRRIKSDSFSPYRRFFLGKTDGANDVQCPIGFIDDMRVIPTLSYSSLSDFVVENPSGLSTVEGLSIGHKGFTVSTSTATIGSVALLSANNTANAYLDFSAEL